MFCLVAMAGVHLRVWVHYLWFGWIDYIYTYLEADFDILNFYCSCNDQFPDRNKNVNFKPRYFFIDFFVFFISWLFCCLSTNNNVFFCSPIKYCFGIENSFLMVGTISHKQNGNNKSCIYNILSSKVARNFYLTITKSNAYSPLCGHVGGM